MKHEKQKAKIPNSVPRKLALMTILTPKKITKLSQKAENHYILISKRASRFDKMANFLDFQQSGCEPF